MVPTSKIKLLNHHLAHAYSALYFVDQKKTHLIFTLDAEGDNTCATVNRYENGKLKQLSKVNKANSLGYLYREITGFLGMKPDEHEFKVMGLAPYADSRQVDRIKTKLKELIWIDQNLEFKSSIPL